MPVTIFSRYYNIKKVEINGKHTLMQRVNQAQKEYPDSISHTIVGNETLDQLAVKYYGREDLWWRIADANRNRFPLDWGPGDTLTIPPVRVATRTPRR